MFRRACKPGDPVVEGGSYWVHHYRHRLAHLAKVAFAIFPTCETCGDRVRYEPAALSSAECELLRVDPDFQHAVGKYPDRPQAFT